jgi:citrate synthase
MSSTVSLKVDNTEVTLPVIIGTENEKAIDVRNLRDKTGCITFDDGYGNTGSCLSSITYIDGEEGVLRYRGYPIEQIAENSNFVETAYLILFGELPTLEQRRKFSSALTENAAIHSSMEHLFEGFPSGSHPMAILSVMLNSLGCYYPHLATNDHQRDLAHYYETAALIISKVRTMAAYSYRASKGLPYIYPRRDLPYCENFLHMMFSEPYQPYIALPEVAAALNLFLLLHAELQHLDCAHGRLFRSESVCFHSSWRLCPLGASAWWSQYGGDRDAKEHSCRG